MAFSGFVAASVAGVLVALHTRLLAPGLDASALGTLIGLATSGTFTVYGLDRLRGRDADRNAWPERTAFVDQNARSLWFTVFVAASITSVCLFVQPPAVWLVCIGAGALGLAHRRLKARPRFKIAYLTGAWWAVVVGLPAVRGEVATTPLVLASVGATTALALLANLIASNGGLARLRAARLCAAAGVLIGVGSGAGALALVPAAQLAALLPAKAGERARLWRIDGSLAVGAVLALAVLELA